MGAAMAFPAVVFRVMIASPSDIASDKRFVVEAINTWNAVHSDKEGVVLMPIAWETSATPEMGNRPQEVLNDQLVSSADLLIALFWSRSGTPTGKSASGTAEEIDQFVTSGRPAMVYFSQAAIPPKHLDPDQYKALQEYRRILQSNGLTWDYLAGHELVHQMQVHLTLAVSKLHGRSWSRDMETAASSEPTKVLRGQFLTEVLWDGEGLGCPAMQVDIDGDGHLENVSLAAGQQGLELRMERRGEVYRTHLSSSPYVLTQLAALDVTNDGYPEIIVAIQKSEMDFEVHVWSFDREAWGNTPRGRYINPLTRVAELKGQSLGFVLPGGRIQLPYGSQGLFTEYRWNGHDFSTSQ